MMIIIAAYPIDTPFGAPIARMRRNSLRLHKAGYNRQFSAGRVRMNDAPPQRDGESAVQG
jgi:hypothetical protein